MAIAIVCLFFVLAIAGAERAALKTYKPPLLYRVIVKLCEWRNRYDKRN